MGGITMLCGVVGSMAGILETLSPAIDAAIEDTEAEVGMTKSALILLVLFKAILTSGLGAVSMKD